MNVVGIITEYNPIHNGHLYHIEKSKELTGADYVIAVMSGNFVQRGQPAYLDKYLRTEMALTCGVDLVLELPCAYAVGSAEYFAMGAVSLLDKLHVVDSLCFGSESGELQTLQTIAGHLAYETPIFQDELKRFLKEGHSYPAARGLALKSCRSIPGALDGMSFISDKELSAILAEPNNTLGIEYLKSLKRRNSSIAPNTIKRLYSYHETSLSGAFTSATALRQALSSSHLEDITPHVPPSVIHLIKENYQKQFPIEEDDISSLLYYKLLTMMKQSHPFHIFQDISNDLGLRLEHEIYQFKSFTQFAEHIKTRQYTLTRIKRGLLHILMDLQTTDYQYYAQHDFIPYARILGFRKSSSAILKRIKENSEIPIINKLSDAKFAHSSAGEKMLKQDIYASDLYRMLQQDKFSQNFGIYNEYTKGVIII